MAPTDVNPTADRQLFVSGDVNHRVIRVPQVEVDAGNNKAREINPSLVYEFEHGHLVIDDKVRERDRQFFKRWGEKLEWGAREYAQPDLPAEEWLRAHSSFEIPGGWGFHEIAAPGADTVQAELTEAVLAGDTERLLGLYEQEEQGQARAEVLEQIQRALKTLEERAATPAA